MLDATSQAVNEQETRFIPPAPAPAGARFTHLYLHLPFCTHKCGYCDFYSVVHDRPGDLHQRFADALAQSMHAAHRAYEVTPVTIFVGGGTPTHLAQDGWITLLHTLTDLGWARHLREWTVEANPESTTTPLMRLLADAGVNRVSIGVQSFDTAGLAVLDRRHDPNHVRRAVQSCRDVGITNLSLDLIFAYPGQDLPRLQRDLDAALALEPKHLSVYGLTFEPDTAITKRLHAGQLQRAPEDLERDLYAALLERLDREGFEQYEISNFARRPTATAADHRCQHNLAYWTNQNWLGLGPAAGSHHQGLRWRNRPNLTEFLASPASPPVEDVERLGPDAQAGEHFLLGLRLNQGLEQNAVHRLAPPGSPRRSTLDELLSLGLLEQDDHRLRLTHRGRFVADSVVAKLL